MGPLSYKEDHEMVFPELNQVNEVDQHIRSSLWMLPKGVNGTINAKILKEALSRTIHDIDLTLSEVASKQNHVPGCVATVVLMIEGQILVANGCNSKAFLCNWHYVEDEDVWIDLSAKLARRYHSRSLSERTEDGTACVLVGRYGNLAPKVTDWKPLSAVNSHLVLASDEIFKTLNEPDICALLHQKRYISYWTLTPIPCYFMTPSDANCIVHTAFLKASKEGGIPYDNSRSGYNLSVAVVRLRSAGGFIIH
ncbi:hypothetical protein SO802_007476 [Lithocarpus litseifolius]|uniref:Uncharacterized protein n=1 Tax=Lithocarpus litseifolius TaxID=425828 RepID=A0AAW2DS33_9ROSI